MTFIPANNLSEREKIILEIAREVGYDHMASMWNIVDKRMVAEMEGYTIAEAITTQLNTGIRCMMFLICHLYSFTSEKGIEGETPEELIKMFHDTLKHLVKGEL